MLKQDRQVLLLAQANCNMTSRSLMTYVFGNLFACNLNCHTCIQQHGAFAVHAQRFASWLVLGIFGAMGKSDATVFAEALQRQGSSRSEAAEVRYQL